MAGTTGSGTANHHDTDTDTPTDSFNRWGGDRHESGQLMLWAVRSITSARNPHRFAVVGRGKRLAPERAENRTRARRGVLAMSNYKDTLRLHSLHCRWM
jgi:hypothetical protein